MSTTAISTPAPTNVTQYQSGFAPEVAGYGQSMVGQAAALTDINTNPYQQYQGETTAQFSPLQQQAFNNAATMQTDPALGQATAASQAATLGGLNTQYTYNPYQTQSFTSPGMAQAYMNPYLQASLAPQLAIQQQQQGAAFGGVEKAVDFRDMDQNRSGGQPQIPVAELAFGGLGSGHILDKLPQPVEHSIHRKGILSIMKPVGLTQYKPCGGRRDNRRFLPHFQAKTQDNA